MRAPDRHDDEIYEHALREFPEFAMAPHSSLIVLDEEWMKSKEGKERWRGFINACVYLSIYLSWPSGLLSLFDAKD